MVLAMLIVLVLAGCVGWHIGNARWGFEGAAITCLVVVLLMILVFWSAGLLPTSLHIAQTGLRV